VATFSRLLTAGRFCQDKHKEGQAMPSLRDQLLRAGVITKEQKRQVDQEERRERKKLQKGQAEEVAQARQRQAYEARLEAQRAADQQRAAAQRTQLEVWEQRLQIRHIIDYWQTPPEPAGTRRWYFVTRSNTIKYLDVSEPTASQLSRGALAIVEHPEEPDTPYVLIDREAATLIARIDPQYVRFYNEEPADE
jgi:uncharacterized protein YaiL (DUF2058 family)